MFPFFLYYLSQNEATTGMQCFPVALTPTHAGQLPTFFFASYGRFMIDRFSLPFKNQLFYKLQKHSSSTG